ncbi:MAG: GHKL domain-containing protein [Bacteroidia bacterium]
MSANSELVVPGECLFFMEEDPAIDDSLELHSSNFIPCETAVLNLGISNNSYFIKFNIETYKPNRKLNIIISNPIIDSVQFYILQNGIWSVKHSGERVDNSAKEISDPYHMFSFIAEEGNNTVYLKVKSTEQLVVPLSVASKESHFTSRNIFYGLFSGVILALFLYNLVLAFLIREPVYYIYLIYLFSIYFAQANLIGLSHTFFNKFPDFNHYSVYIFSALVGLSAIKFMELFLDLKVNLPKSMLFVRIGYVIYICLLVMPLFKVGTFAYMLMQLNGVYAAIVAITIALTLTLKGNISAKFYLAAWSVFSVGIIIFVLKDYGLLPFNNFTRLTMTYGVIVEVILLSIALAHRINTLKKDNERAQERIIEEMSRNESLIKNQNILLEDKVKKRTEELEHTLSNLKQAQVKLIESEKMASLGLLTAGIAHEINNPINYVTANVIPLRENVDMLTKLIDAYKGLSPDNFDKQSEEIIALEKEIELDYTLTETKELINGIEEGAKRTYHIVDGLRTFSRSDSTDKKLTNVNKGVQSTLSVLKSQLKGIKIELDLDNELPKVNCQLGKLNQVFLNLINNAIQAVEERYGKKSDEPCLIIRSYSDKQSVFIEIEDNGLGIPQEAQHKIFEPFYTSKPVGEGTGLGLSISYSIIEDHQGSLTFESAENKGTTFKIELPV